MATNTELVQQLYVAYFNRPADVNGLNYYVGVLEASADPVATAKIISADFAKASEYQNTYANLSPEATINAIYHNLFGHEADIPGLKYWSDLYAAGKVTLATVVADVAAGAQSTDATAYASKVTAAAAFTAQIALSADQKLAYESSPAALAVAQAYLAGVTDDASLKAALADVATTASAVVPSVTSTLTAGIDTLTGTSGNDTFNTLVLSSGAAVKTLNAGDVIDGGAGTNTLNVTNSGAGFNDEIAGTFKNIQIININNTAGAAAAVTAGDTAVDVSKLGTAAKQVWQIGKATDVTNLGASTTAGYKSIAAAGTFNVGAAATATGVSVALKDVAEGSTVAATGTKLTSVTLSGTVTDTNTDGTIVATNVSAALAKDAQTFTLTSGVDAVLTVTEDGTSTKHLTTVDLSASTGGVSYTGLSTVATIKGGSGDDVLNVKTATLVASSGVTAVSASVTAGEGENTINVETTGSGTTTVTGGSGVDTVNILDRGTGKLTVNLGAGNDIFTVDTTNTAILAGDLIDGGAGTDTLALQVVGSNNIGAFVNFEVFDVKDLDHNLDVNILATNNTVTEFVASGSAGAAVALQNIGANVGFRVTGDADGAAITLTQKTGGALNVSIDSHETAAATGTGVGADIVASNATSVAVAFKETFVDDASGAGDNIATLKLTTAAATAVTVASGGGDNASNVLNYVDTGSGGKLTSLTVTGDTALTLTVTDAVKLATIDAGAATGGLTFAIAPSELLQGAEIKLGSGTDSIDATLAVDATKALFSLSGFEKAGAAAVGTDVDAATAAIAVADTVLITGAQRAADAASGTLTGTDSIKDGVLTFGGAGPATLAAAILQANADVAAAHDTVVFKYLGDTYIFTQGADNTVATDDVVVKLTGITGVTALAENGTTDHFFIV